MAAPCSIERPRAANKKFFIPGCDMPSGISSHRAREPVLSRSVRRPRLKLDIRPYAAAAVEHIVAEGPVAGGILAEISRAVQIEPIRHAIADHERDRVIEIMPVSLGIN